MLVTLVFKFAVYQHFLQNCLYVHVQGCTCYLTVVQIIVTLFRAMQA